MTAPAPVDLRSDTVTRPTAAMRRAMAAAEVGDDVYGDDPTVLELERRIAAIAGFEAAVYVPSGTMGNQLAVRCHTGRGDEVLLDADSHIYVNEQGAVGALAGCLAHPIASERGAIAPAAIEAAVRDPSDDHVARVSLLCLENTHNRHGGSILPLETLTTIAAAARGRGLAVHLDGARLWNASVATGVAIRTWAAPVDSVMMCFSKGLGAPIGSVLAGRADFIRRARRVRKQWGGGMRQVGVLAAAALHALDHHVERLAEDHARAKRLAAGLGGEGVRVAEPETNIVMIELLAAPLDRGVLLAALERRGVRMGPSGPRRIRAITHLDVDDAGAERAIAAFRAALGEALAGGASPHPEHGPTTGRLLPSAGL
ncbi:MAG: aminotransferase class I/II-fold pyridoxal phosphate-dependent enzyme [Candidatus Eisenbacteria bacterium]|uniref:Aminotransferase class I/II-fold pyridoxal phosphate-dependent enzyme n=1 Tax=Eiseniibacteriota bacterium TaxID=2212470 RepID=A0A9D6LB49_UNCEI|nr:aminotransferase class I/II-fold pyridoxal phosphate-dependent enzyme [Candidatus Eisenbacteria bacterium]MBI3540325.1 aminotransferase class I/II-fold pyridoxal phosphate-dependent enzyme [Candidatus Eisenbacteria bacterium]